MTQKRFMKMLMSNGVSRNEARGAVRAMVNSYNRRSKSNHLYKMRECKTRFLPLTYDSRFEDCLAICLTLRERNDTKTIDKIIYG